MVIFLLMGLIWIILGVAVFLFPYQILRISLIPSICLNKKIPDLFMSRKEFAKSLNDLKNDPDLFKARNRVVFILIRISGFFGIVFGLALLFFYFFIW